MIYFVASSAIDTETFEVRRDGERVPVEPQVFDLLLLLIENRDRMVTRDEIIERVWKGRIVSEAAISSRIKAARRVIGDDGKAQAMIRTIHRRGIRFVGEVTTREATGIGAAATGTDISAIEIAPAETPRDSAALIVSTPMEAPQSDEVGDIAGIDLSLPKRPSLVVLPFYMLAGSEDQQRTADGLALDIMTGLARTRWLFVISRGTAFKFRGPSQDPKSIASQVGVRYVLQGNIQFHGKRVRIHAALTDAVVGREVWADHFDRAMDDIFLVQDEIASIIVGTVETEIEQSERQRALLTPPASLDAWSAYHRGAWHMFQFTRDGYEEAEKLFKRAAELDPGASRVFAGLSFVHWQRAFLEIGNDRQSEIDQATELARHALMLDPRDPQGHWALGRAFLLRQEFDLAIEEIEQSVTLNPNFAIGHYSVAFARALATQNGRSEEFGQARTAAEPIRPDELCDAGDTGDERIAARAVRGRSRAGRPRGTAGQRALPHPCDRGVLQRDGRPHRRREALSRTPRHRAPGLSHRGLSEGLSLSRSAPRETRTSHIDEARTAGLTALAGSAIEAGWGRHPSRSSAAPFFDRGSWFELRKDQIACLCTFAEQVPNSRASRAVLLTRPPKNMRYTDCYGRTDLARRVHSVLYARNGPIGRPKPWRWRMRRRAFLAGTGAAVLGADVLPFLKSSAAWAKGAGDTLVVAVGTTINSLDLHRVGTNRPSYQATINLYDRLLRFGTKVNAEGAVVYDYDTLEGELAESWVVAPDGMSADFKLRQDAKFWDGTPVTAADVKWSFDRAVSLGSFLPCR